jgi:fermentation-respiration switch protein FrsA (DUF1100 family)
MMKNKILASVLLLLIGGCTTIEISESDAFDPHVTISADQFPIHSYTLHDLNIETEDGETLDAWFLEREGAEKTVIYYGGNGFLMMKSRPLINAYADLPVHLLMIDYRGYGRSTGKPTVDGVKTDAKAAFHLAKNDLPVEPGPIYVHGHSMGSFLAAYIADSEDVAGYMLESPITEVDGWTKRLVPWLLRPFVSFDIAEPVKTQSNIEPVQRIDKPLLVIGGDQDEITPFRMAEELYEKSPSEEKSLVKIEDGNHNDLPTFSAYKSALIEYLGDD